MMQKLQNDISGVAWFISLGILAVIGAIGVSASYFIFQRPDVTYNIQDVGFSIAGVQISSIWIILIVLVVIVLIVWYIARRRKTKTDNE